MKLYEIKESVSTLIDYINENELNEEDFKTSLDELNEELEVKAEGIVRYMKNIEGDISVFKEEERILNAKRKTLEREFEWYKSYLATTLKALDISELKTRTFKLKFQNNQPSVNVLDVKLIPEIYKLPQEIKIILISRHALN